MNTKKLIEKLNDYLREIVVNNEQYEMFVEIKSILEQQHQHEQNILNYGTDEPEIEPRPEEELVGVYNIKTARVGNCIYGDNHIFHKNHVDVIATFTQRK